MLKQNEMNLQEVLTGLKEWFAAYVARFSSGDPLVQENVDLKRAHTLRVCEAILDIGRSVELCNADLCLAEICALLHDIGRFEQLRQYRTFSDLHSEDHARLGVRVIREENILDGLESVTADLILWAVGHHNRAVLPSGGGRPAFFLKLLRDADKVDIWQVVTNYYANSGNNRSRAIELDLPDTDTVSEPIYRALMRGELAKVTDLKTLNDFKALQIGWVYDLNFPRTYQIVQERKYLEKIRDAISAEVLCVQDIYTRARRHLEQKV